METTRHFVTTVFVVYENEIALHDHKKLDLYLPPGGHINRDELPQVAAHREVSEETGLEITLHPEEQDLPLTESSQPISQPNHLLLDDIVHLENGMPAHQHINLVYFAEADTKEINPVGRDEVSSDDWVWVSKEELKNEAFNFELDESTKQISIEAIDYVNN